MQQHLTQFEKELKYRNYQPKNNKVYFFNIYKGQIINFIPVSKKKIAKTILNLSCGILSTITFANCAQKKETRVKITKPRRKSFGKLMSFT